MKKNCKSHNVSDDFHAGRFLREVMCEAGRDTVWLAGKTGMTEEALQALFEKPNMDARLFVKVGEWMQPIFFQRVDEMIFGESKTRPVA